MRRLGSGGRLSEGGSGDFGENANPMDGIANLADVMLVLACGIMLALVIFWNGVIGSSQSQPVEIVQGEEITGSVQNMGEGEGVLSENGQYQRMGTVYQDADGNLYMVENSGENEEENQ